jgi:predicted Zn-dependent protease
MRSPVLAPGDLNEDDVVQSLDTGIYLSNLHYLNWSDRPGGRITGMTRYACFWVENGEVVAPIENMRFDDSIYNFFGENLESVTDKSHLHPTVQTYEGRELGGVSCPGILLKSFELTL